MIDVYTLDKLATLNATTQSIAPIGMDEDDGNGKQKWGTLHTYMIHQKLATSRNLSEILLVRSSNHHTFDDVPSITPPPTQRSLALALYLAAPSLSHC